MPTIQALQAKGEEALGKDLSQREKSENENESDSEDKYSNESSGRDDNCAGNADENDVSTSRSTFQRDMFFSIIRRQNRTRLAGIMQKNNVFKPQLLEMKLNWIHIITSSMWVQMHTFTLAITVFFSSWCLSEGLTFFE